MKLKLGKQIKPPTNKYRFKADFMIGDGDDYKDIDFLVDKDHPDIERLVGFLDAAINISGEDIGETEDFEYFNNIKVGVDLVWPYESDAGFYFDLTGYNISFYNELGEEFEIEVEK